MKIQDNSEDHFLVCTVYGPNAPQDGFQALVAEWDILLKQSRFNSFFLTHAWQTTWWHYLGHGDLWIIAFHDPATEQIVGIAPLYRFQHEEGTRQGQHQLSIVGCIEVSDYLDLIVAVGWEDAVQCALLGWLQSDAAPAWDILDLCNLPQDSMTYQTLPSLYEAAGLTVSVTQEDVAPQFELPLHYETYLQNQVDKKQRHEIRRKQRRVEREATVDFYMVGPEGVGTDEVEHDIQAEIADFIRLQRASSDDKAGFMNDEMQHFFTTMATKMLEAGYLRLFFLKLNGQKVAALFAFEHDKRLWLYNSGYDASDVYAQWSPGWVLLAYTIQYAITNGCHTFDFMQGDEGYKYRFGSQDYKVMRVVVERPSLSEEAR